MFTAEWSNLESIGEFLWSFLWSDGVRYKGINNLFYNLPKLKTIGFGMLSPSALKDECADLYTIINWEDFINRGGTIESSSWRYVSFNFNKQITIDNFNKLCNLILKSSFTNIANLFHNCTIMGYTDNLTFGTTTTINNTITDISHAFRNCKMSNNDKETPIPLSANFFKNFTNITDVAYAFSGSYLKNPIPFDFFNKRIEDDTINRNVYVKIGEEYKLAYLTTYTYKHDIKDFRYLFYNTKWLNNSQYDPSLYNIPQNRVEYDGNTYNIYYNKVSHVNEDNEIYYTYEQHTVTQGTEITDALNLNGYYITKATVANNSIPDYNNFSLNTNNAVNKLCIPPDLFYGASQTASVEYQYALNCQTPIQGIIPKNIFMYNRSGTVNNTFKDQHIIPQLSKTYQNGNSIVNVYTHFPSNYTINTNLDDAFNCQAVVPMNDTNATNWVFMILKDTIPQNVNSLRNAFAIKVQSNYWYDGQNKNNNNYINYMGNLTSTGCTEGFDMDYYYSLKLDNIFYGQLNSFIYGKLFNSTFDAANIALLSTNNKVLSHVGTQGNSISQFMQFPIATNDIPYFFYQPNTRLQLKKSQIPEASRQYYINAGITILNA